MNTKDMRRIHLCMLSGILIAILCVVLTSAAIPDNNLAFARCPNGTHISPSGDCETVAAHAAGLPRCAIGFHISPGGICEQILSKRVKVNSNGSNNVSTFNLAASPLINSTKQSVSISHMIPNSTNANNTIIQPFNASQLTASPLAINHTLDQYCDSPGHFSCYGVGFSAGRSAPGTNCPISYSFTFCEGYHVGSGMGIVNRGATGGETDVGDAISSYLRHFPNNMDILKNSGSIFRILGP